MSIINPPPISTVDSQASNMSLVNVNDGWRNFFNSVFTITSALSQSGTTANRPTRPLWPGRMYFDTTLGYAVWWDGTQWVDATGTPA